MMWLPRLAGLPTPITPRTMRSLAATGFLSLARFSSSAATSSCANQTGRPAPAVSAASARWRNPRRDRLFEKRPSSMGKLLYLRVVFVERGRVCATLSYHPRECGTSEIRTTRGGRDDDATGGAEIHFLTPLSPAAGERGEELPQRGGVTSEGGYRPRSTWAASSSDTRAASP